MWSSDWAQPSSMLHPCPTRKFQKSATESYIFPSALLNVIIRYINPAWVAIPPPIVSTILAHSSLSNHSKLLLLHPARSNSVAEIVDLRSRQCQRSSKHQSQTRLSIIDFALSLMRLDSRLGALMSEIAGKGLSFQHYSKYPVESFRQSARHICLRRSRERYRENWNFPRRLGKL